MIALVGAGSGKSIAKIISGPVKPTALGLVCRVDEQRLFGGSCLCVDCGASARSQKIKLNRLSIETIGQFAALTDSEAANILDATIAPTLYRLARGINDRLVTERAEAKQISSESTFVINLTSLEQLCEAFEPIASHVYMTTARQPRRALSSR